MSSGTIAEKKQVVLDTVVAVMARVNGIFMREIGTFFQLIDNTDDIFYIDDDRFACSQDDSDVFDYMEDFFEEKRITDADYDIGHIFVRSGGGVVGRIGLLCDDLFKHEGLTGRHDPSDSFLDVIVLAHELGTFFLAYCCMLGSYLFLG